MTDPTGRCFLSYKRERADEAALLIRSLRDHGIPMWQDASDLPSAVTETALIEVLTDPETAGAILLITPEVKRSDVIRKVEVPRIFNRATANTGFFAVPIAAGGLGYGDLADVLGPGVGLIDIAGFNVVKAPSDPLDEIFAREVSLRTLRERLRANHRALAPGEPLTLQVGTRSGLPATCGFSLRVDLTHRFNGRHALPGSWDDVIIPAFTNIATEVARSAPGRALEVSGFLSLASAVALGASLPSLGPVRAQWRQEQTKFGAPPDLWSLSKPGNTSGFEATTRPLSASGNDVALLVSATNDVVSDFSISRSGLPLRAVVHVAPAGERPSRLHLDAGQARGLACLAVDAIRKAVGDYSARGTIHLFLAVPAGVAFMIGQQLNTLGLVQTYEHDPSETPPYRPAVTLKPSA